MTLPSGLDYFYKYIPFYHVLLLPAHLLNDVFKNLFVLQDYYLFFIEMKFTWLKINYFKGTIRWHLVHLQGWVPTTSVSFQNIFITPEWQPHTH